MLIGLDGTVGSIEALGRAAGDVISSRAGGVWREMNAPVPVSKYMNSQPANITANAANLAANIVSRMAMPLGFVPTNPLPRVIGNAAGAMARGSIAVGSGVADQVGKVIGAAGQGSIDGYLRSYADVRKEAADMVKYGFINQLVTRFSGVGNKYFPGPTTLGSEDGSITASAASYAAAHIRSAKSDPLVIAGYSRGGHNAVNVARRLCQLGIGVDLLILLDPVDRDPGTPSGNNIPANVLNLILIGRPGFIRISWNSFQIRLLSLTASIEVPSNFDFESRFYFGRMISKDDIGKVKNRDCFEVECTHAAQGGVPWTGDRPNFLSQEKDRSGALQVASALDRCIRNISAKDSRLRLNKSIELMQPAV